MKKGKEIARKLRRKMTPPEARLWGLLRNRQIENQKFRRQEPLGKYVVDFICYEKKLVIELDGSQHLDNQFNDEKRTRDINEMGFQVIRFSNDEVMAEINEVVAEIIIYLK